MSKVDISIQFFRNTLMVRKLLAIIRRDRIGSYRRRLHELDNSVCHGLSGLALDLSQQSQTGLSFRKRDNSMTMSFSDNRIHFPITQPLACVHNSRPLVDTYPVLDLSTPVIAPVTLPALLPLSGSSSGIVGDDGDLLPHVYP